MEKVIRDGKVAVLISRGFGAGWSTWNGDKKELLFDPEIVSLVEQRRNSEITEDLVKKILKTDDHVCVLGAKSLSVEWIPVGTSFYINEYDGSESIVTNRDLTFTA